MKKQEIKELHQKPLQDLKQLLEKLQGELIQLNVDKSTGRLKDLHAVYKKRKEIAVVKTIIMEKERR